MRRRTRAVKLAPEVVEVLGPVEIVGIKSEQVESKPTRKKAPVKSPGKATKKKARAKKEKPEPSNEDTLAALESELSEDKVFVAPDIVNVTFCPNIFGGKRAKGDMSPWWLRRAGREHREPRDDEVIRDVLSLEYQHYRMSWPAYVFHNSTARFRMLIWGVRSGKTRAGAREMMRGIYGTRKEDGERLLSWMVAPTTNQLDAAEAELWSAIDDLSQQGVSFIPERNTKHGFLLFPNGHKVFQKSADRPNSLRSATITGVLWGEEAAYIRHEAWNVCRQRVATSQADIILTSSSADRNWTYDEARMCGLPKNEEYGEYMAEDGQRFISYHPTEHFPWVPADELEKIKDSISSLMWDRDFMARFCSSAAQVFRQWARTRTHAEASQGVGGCSIGFDPGRFQDFAAVVAEDSTGYVVHAERWRGLEWGPTVEKVAGIAQKYSGPVTLDRANVGSALEEMLIAKGVRVFPVDLNAPKVKADLVTSLQVAIDKNEIHIPFPDSKSASGEIAELLDELRNYEYRITGHGNVSYSAPKGLHDDLVMALALANWGRARGLASNCTAVGAGVSREKIDAMAMRAAEVAARNRGLSPFGMDSQRGRAIIERGQFFRSQGRRPGRSIYGRFF